MDCKKVRYLMADAADGQLSGSALDKFHLHLQLCPDCADLYKAQTSAIEDLNIALQFAAADVQVSNSFTSGIILQLESDTHSLSTPFSLRFSKCISTLAHSRAALALAACVLLFAATIATGTLISNVLDSSPVASTQVYSGHLITFRVQPRPDGKVIAGIHSHRYCQLSRSTEDSLR